MCCSTLKLEKMLFILGTVLLQLGKKHYYFLAKGTIPKTGVGFIARKFTVTFLCQAFGSYCLNAMFSSVRLQTNLSMCSFNFGKALLYSLLI